jgi:hypothetical protein
VADVQDVVLQEVAPMKTVDVLSVAAKFVPANVTEIPPLVPTLYSRNSEEIGASYVKALNPVPE